MEFTEDQKKEHRVIEEALDILEEINKKFENDEEVKSDILGDLIDFFRIFADKCHHGKEQDLLFPALEMTGMSRVNSPIGILLREHEISRSYIQNIDRALQDYEIGDITAKKDILQNSRVYIELLNQHIEKEDSLLYPMAEEKISDDRKIDLLNAYENFEKEVIREGVHEKYHDMIERLKNGGL